MSTHREVVEAARLVDEYLVVSEFAAKALPRKGLDALALLSRRLRTLDARTDG